jgi:hypothetical protein
MRGLAGRGSRTVSYGHLGEFDLLRRPMFRFIIALIAKVTAVLFLHLLSAPAPFGCCSWAHSVGPSARKHTAIFIAIFQRQTNMPWRLEIL